MIWNGIDVDVWGPAQTLKPRQKMRGYFWFTGYDELGSFDWWNYIEEIPLDIRYASFKARLARKMNGSN